MAFDFETLVVNQKSFCFVDAVWQRAQRLSWRFACPADKPGLAALSIVVPVLRGANRFFRPDRRSIFGVVRRSTRKCVPLLESVLKRQMVSELIPGEFKLPLERNAGMPSGRIKDLGTWDL